MICKYYLAVTCACPVDDGRDAYWAEFESSVLVKVEDILAAVAPFSDKKVFQEDMTRSLARTLGCKVTTTGMHSGVLTVVSAP